MSDILIIQNARYEGPAVLGELLRLDGFDINTVLAKRERIPVIDSCAIVILGAPESANDDLPYLKEELNLIIESIRKNIPVLAYVWVPSSLQKHLGQRSTKEAGKKLAFIMIFNLIIRLTRSFSMTLRTLPRYFIGMEILLSFPITL